MKYIIKYDSIIIVISHSNTSPRVDMSLHSHTVSWFRANQSLLFSIDTGCLATHTNFIVFGFDLNCTRTYDPLYSRRSH